MGDGQKENYFQKDDFGKEYPSVSRIIKKEMEIVLQRFAIDRPRVSRNISNLEIQSFRGNLSFDQNKSIIDYPFVSNNAKTKSIFHDAYESLAIAIRVLEDELYSIKEKWIVLLRVLSVICELTKQNGLSPYIRRIRDTIHSLMISLTNLMTLKPINNKFDSNKCSLSQLDIEGVKVRLNSLKMLLYISSRLPIYFNSPNVTSINDEDYGDFRSFKYDDSFMTSSTNIYVARGIFNLYEVISNTKNHTIAAVANDSLEQTQKFISNGCSSLPYLFEYSSSSEFIYEDLYTNETTLIIRLAGTKNKEVTISQGLIEAVDAACKTIKQYSMVAGKNICNLPLDLLDDDEYIKCFINYGKYCELYHYFREDCKRLIFEGHLQTVIYSMLKVDEEMCNFENISSNEKGSEMLKNPIFSFVDFKDYGTPVEQIYADYAMKYINVHKKSLHNYISKMSLHLEKKHRNPDRVHKMLNISKNDYDEAKECEELDSFITKLVEGADFDVRKMALENFYINVDNKVYVASILLQYAVMENDSGMNMVRRLLRLNADPRVENLRDGMSAVGIAMLYEDSVEGFLQEIIGKVSNFFTTPFSEQL